MPDNDAVQPADPDASRYSAALPADPDATHYGDAPTPTPSLLSTARNRCLPRRFADYELLEEIARGGMGVVYKARQLGPDGRPLRLVALKMVLGGAEAGPR